MYLIFYYNKIIILIQKILYESNKIISNKINKTILNKINKTILNKINKTILNNTKNIKKLAYNIDKKILKYTKKNI